MPINYDGRHFRVAEASPNGEAGSGSVFAYHQAGDVVWATYAGGAIRRGTLLARVEADDTLQMAYQQIGYDGTLRTGVCTSTPETLPDGRIRLHERWRWTNGDLSAGHSILEEIADPGPHAAPG